MPSSKMNILRQSLQKQNLNTMQKTRSTIYSTTPSTILSDSPERPKVQTPAWVAENKATGEKNIRKFNSAAKQTELQGKFSYNSFDSNIEQIDDFQNLKNREYEFINQENYISVKGKLKQNQSFWKNTIKADDTVLNIIQEGYRMPLLETPDTARFSNNKSAISNSKFVGNSIKEMLATGTILERDPPRFFNPLSVSIDSSGKKRLILDLKYINMHLYKDKIKFDD